MHDNTSKVDAILTRLENEVARDVALRVQQHRSGRSPKSSHAEARAAIEQLIAEARIEAKEEHRDDLKDILRRNWPSFPKAVPKFFIEIDLGVLEAELNQMKGKDR